MKKEEIYCRSCYNHLAGKIGVKITRALLENKLLELDGNTFIVTKKGEQFFADAGINLNSLRRLRRPLTRACLDGSEKEYHLAGSLGDELMANFLSKNYLFLTPGNRAIGITAAGMQFFEKNLNIRGI